MTPTIDDLLPSEIAEELNLMGGYARNEWFKEFFAALTTDGFFNAVDTLSDENLRRGDDGVRYDG